jgi:hypothetical protein
MRIFAVLAAVFLLFVGRSAHAAPPVPAAGDYVCFTFQVSQQLHERMRTSVATLEEDWKMVYEQRTDIFPAGISIALDGKRNYKVVGTRAVGTYSYNAKTGELSFAGEASELGLRRYVVQNGLYIMMFIPNEDVFYQCEFDSGNKQIGAKNGANTTAPNSGQGAQALIKMPARSTQAITAQDVNGRFEGNYACGAEGKTKLVLDMQADANGRLKATFSFGGTNNVPFGSYTMRGLWSPESFFLTADSWIQQPDGFVMVNLDGYRGEGGELAGEILYQGCSGYSVSRK